MIENETVRPRESILAAIRSALESGGVEFLGKKGLVLAFGLRQEPRNAAALPGDLHNRGAFTMNRRKVLQMAAAAPLVRAAMATPDIFDVRSFGAAGDGTTIDTQAVERAIAAAAAAGGGTVLVPAGTYACTSIRLQSHIVLTLAPGAVLLGVPPHAERGYDKAEPSGPWAAYQDFGHDHWHDSLIWGEDIHDVAILGPGLVWARD